MLITNKAEQKARTEEKSRTILEWLRDEKFSNLATISLLLTTGKPNASKALSRLERLGMVEGGEVQVGLGKAKFWTLTHHGMALAIQPDDPKSLERFSRFEPSRLSESTIMHGLACQAMRLQLSLDGWTDWQPEIELRNQPFSKVPDGMARDPAGLMVALELERSFKSFKRYQQILADYLKMLADQKIDRVQYFSPSPAMASKLDAIFRSISKVNLQGRTVAVQPEWLTRFSFNVLSTIKGASNGI